MGNGSSFRKVTLPVLRGKVAASMNVEEEELKSSSIKSVILETFQEFLLGNSSKDNVENEVEKEPKKQKKHEVKSENKPKESKKPKVKSAPIEAKTSTASAAKNPQIERLKSYVFKCGVRKVWKKEFEGLTDKQCIAKLHEILKELGIEGKPSLEQCKAIKKRREFEAELREIDTSNIIEGKRRRLSGPQKVLKEPESSDESETEPDKEEEEEKDMDVSIDLKAFGDSESE